MLLISLFLSPQTAPEKPQKLEGSVDKKTKTIQLQWEPPSDDGGSLIIAYHMEYRNILEGDWKKAENVGPETFQWAKQDCDAVAVYNFRVCAENKNGSSDMVELKEPVEVLGT